MKDNHKTKVQQMNESEELRRGIAELETKRKQAQEKLKRYRGNLEDLMEERSAELKRIHKQLKREITKRKQAEEMLRNNEEKYRELINTSVDGVISADTHMRIILWNPGAERIFGYTEEETLGQSLMKIVPERYRNAMEKGFVEFQKNGSGPVIGKTLEFESVRKDGTEVPIELSVSSRKVGGRHIATAIVRDITDRKRAEEQLQESKEKYRSLFGNMNEGFAYCKIIVDKNNKPVDFEYIEVNNAFEMLTGLKKEHVTGKRSTEAIPGIKKTHPELFKIYGRVALTGKATNFEIYFEPLKIWLSISVYCPKRGYFVAVFDNITERKNAEAIRNVLFNISNATTETSSLNDLLATIHKQVGTLMDAKNFFVCLALDTEKNLYTFPYYKDINPEDVVEPDETYEITEGLTHHVLKTKKYFLGNKQQLKKIGVIGTVPESWLGVPLKTEGGDVDGVAAVQSYEKEAYSEKDAQVLSIIASNITGALKYKKAEEQIKASLKEKEVLLREIHHRVKNNLQIISSLLKLQSQHIEDKRYVEMFKDSQNRIKSMSLIHEMLYQSKHLSKINFKEYIRTLTNYLLRSCWPSPPKIALKIDSENVYLPVDNAIPCGLIINELVSNSLKHAFPDGKEGQIKIALHSINEEDIELVISDDGVGIPEDLDIRSTKSLGLHLVTILAEDQLHGEIKLDRNKGTEFQIKLRGVK